MRWDAVSFCFVGGELVEGWNSRKAAVYSRGEAWFEGGKYANECCCDVVPLIVINTLVIVYELVLG